MNDNESALPTGGPQGADGQSARCNPLSQTDYLASARAACLAGDDVLGMHLYLAAFETQSQESYPPSQQTLDALRSAWKLAIALKERSIAEYIFEKIEPYLSAQEMGEYADALQQLALDRLEQFGLSREELEQMADAISDDFFGGPLGQPMVHIEQFTIPGPVASDASVPSAAEPASADQAALPGQDAPLQPQPDAVAGAEEAQVPAADGAAEACANDAASAQDVSAAAPSTAVPPAAPKVSPARETYADLAGYGSVIEAMHRFGIGMKGNAEFEAFVAQLNQLHGIDRMPALDALLFCSAEREDANRFLEATVHEIGLPVIRMAFEESLQGAPMLVVASEGVDHRGRQNFMRMGFTQPMVLVLEDIDTWLPADIDGFDEHEIASMQASRGAREAIGVVRQAVEDPDVYVLASACSPKAVDPFFFDLLDPLSLVEIGLPGASERREVWQQIMGNHSSLASLPLDELVELSAGLSRFDIASAARDAIEDSYKLSLIKRQILTVSPQSVFERLAAYQPIDSDEYRALEQKVLEGFRLDISDLSGLVEPAEGAKVDSAAESDQPVAPVDERASADAAKPAMSAACDAPAGAVQPAAPIAPEEPADPADPNGKEG